jgi:hypothetical protein
VSARTTPPDPPDLPGRVSDEWAIRAQLMNCRGAQLCTAPRCRVIIQGGRVGASMHFQIVHPDLEAWLR